MRSGILTVRQPEKTAGVAGQSYCFCLEDLSFKVKAAATCSDYSDLTRERIRGKNHPGVGRLILVTEKRHEAIRLVWEKTDISWQYNQVAYYIREFGPIF